MNNSDKVYPQVDDVPDNIKKEWLNNVPQSTPQSMKQLKYITPEFFHNWLNDCPVHWERIEDNVDEISIKFFLPLEEENDNSSEGI